MRSHFRLPSHATPKPTNPLRLSSQAALTCALSGAAALLNGVCSAQIAADYASNPTYAGGWAAGQNGGYGFGAWSFNGTTDPSGTANPGAQQGMSSSSALGTAWTLFNLGSAPHSGISDVGRSINGGLQVGQTFETVLNNPTGYHFYGGYDILFTGGPDNQPAGNNSATLRVSEFNYWTSYPNWIINDGTGGHTTSLSSTGTGAAGMKLDLTLTSASTYSMTLTPLGNPSGAYSYSGTYSGPIDYVNYRLWDNTSAGINDTANNLEISSMTLVNVPEPSALALLGLGATGLLCCRRRK